MWKSIVNFFKAIDNGLIVVEDYFDYRVKTGKWVGDVKDLSQDTNKTSSSMIHRARRSRITRISLLFVLHIWNNLLRIAAIEKGAAMMVDTFSIGKKIFIETIVGLQLSFLSIVILFNLFINAPFLFFISLFPILFFNAFLISTLYFMVQDKKTKLPIKSALQLSFQAFSKLSTLVLVYIITGLVLISAFFIMATFYSYFFTSIRLSWENAFAYWVVIAPAFLLLLAVLFGLSIIASQAYYILLFEGKNVFYSFRKGTELLKEHLTWFSFFYLLFALIFLHISYWVSLLFFPLGFIASLFFFIQLFIFLGFLLRREFPHAHIAPSERVSGEDKMLLSFFMVFGFLTYFAVAALSIKEHVVIIDAIDQTQKRFLVSQQLNTYMNTRYGYTIDYPQGWAIHEEKDTSTTIYNNETKTTVGGMFVNIKALPFSESDFNKLYNARSGLTSYNTFDMNVTIKVNNFFIDYKYPAVKYTYLKSGDPSNEYSINYLIHRDDLMYVVSFITYDRNIQGENLHIFETMINSFSFTY